ncbi:hypothetical protein C1T17_01845 [Sphingobium sp. SCG-1]|uniref:MFS transporter n=1 Tax=Sphingobium sp. SCG-1 TaxID=2072936 RepID=UPI000CD6AFCC|nr:MFS transporter [Sphingobium sp. SCG-1]AUW57010.1 hypothetical protein C1T17_01845 [Sphingobium sp. SCG-1]
MNSSKARPAAERPHVGWATLLFYGVGACSSGIKMRALSSFLLIFYNQAVGMSPASVALAITIITIFDAIVDPLVGYLSDNFKSRWGRRHPFMYVSALPLALSFFCLWNPPAGISSELLFYYLLACLMVLRLFDTFFELPSIALAPELIHDYHRRTLIVSIRIFFRTVAGVLFTIAAFQIFLSDDQGGVTNRSGYFSFAVAGSVVMAISILASTMATHRFIPWLRKPEATTSGQRQFFADIIRLLRDPAARIMLVTGMLVAIVSGARNGLDLYFGLYFWQLTQTQLALVATLTAVATLLGTAILPPLAVRLGKRSTLIAVYIIGFLNMAVPVVLRLFDVLPENGTNTIFAIIAVESFLQGMLYVMSAAMMNSMLSDVVEELEVKTGRRSEGLLFSADAFFSKAVSGVGILISGAILSLIQFPTKAKPGTLPAETLWNLGAVYVPAVAVFTILVIFVVKNFPINQARHERNLAILREREGGEASLPTVTVV